MNPLFHSIAVQKHTISWALIVALLLLTLVPFHLHLHHDDVPAAGASAHEHVADIHVYADAHGADHHESSHALDPAPDITLKNSSVQLPVFAILLTLFILLPLGGRTFCYTRLALTQRLPRFIRHTTPPLRAPPRG